MKRIIGLIVSLVFVTGLIFGQGLQRPVVLTVTGGALPQDSLNAMVHYKDSSATSGVVGYATATMLNTRMLKSDSSVTYGGATKYITPNMFGDSLGTFWHRKDTSATSGVKALATATMLGLRVLRSDSSLTTGIVGYVSSTMGATLLPKADSSSVGGTATKYVTPTMLALKAPLASPTFTTTVSVAGTFKINSTSVTAALIDSINITSDSLHIFSGGKVFGIPAHGLP
jgi:hypothetical protein